MIKGIVNIIVKFKKLHDSVKDWYRFLSFFR